jgi:hypothetical protein
VCEPRPLCLPGQDHGWMGSVGLLRFSWSQFSGEMARLEKETGVALSVEVPALEPRHLALPSSEASQA